LILNGVKFNRSTRNWRLGQLDPGEVRP
jgi:hypothetical protein